MNNQYNNIIIPKELDQMVKETIQKEKRKKHFITSFSAVAATLIIFTSSLNLSSTFAESMGQIPVIKDIASILTFRSYEKATEEITSDVTVPTVTIESASIDEYINETIESKVKELLDEAQLRAEEYKEAYLDTGGTEAGYKEKNMKVTVDYELFSQDDQYLSFRVFTHETLAAVYSENLYFTIDLKEKQLVTLQDLLGHDYINIMTTSVVASIEQAVKKGETMYFEDYLSPDFKVREDIDFYIKDHELFIVFQKYELAAGAAGRLEFNIPIN